jgi:hypothetical protein
MRGMGMDFDLGALTKGEIRKLNALRKSIGEDLANSTFAKWLKSKPKKETATGDKSASKIEEILWGLVKNKEIRIPKGGYALKRGRGRVIVSAVAKVRVANKRKRKA